MKQRLLTTLTVLLLAQQSFAEDSLLSAETKNYIGFGAIIGMLLLFLATLLVLLRTFKVLTKAVLKLQGYTKQQIEAELKPAKKEKKPKSEVWQKLLSLKPLSEEKDILIPHAYDGIHELDNPTPSWFMVLFYGTIIFGLGYLMVYHVFGTGQLQDAEYKTEIAQADAAKKIYLSKAANLVDENTVKAVNDPAAIAEGKAVFKASCAPCHGENGQGVVGPNLTDEYWLHGAKITDIFKTIKYGVQAKGMPTWEKQLSPKQIADVANYIISIQGTKPAGAKEPQGEKETVEKLALN
ncbi:cbb3-type cytochrome c oxidase N-terminal domain-containing protein [Mucilaginibacter pedocola]|uniref:Cytochrome C n=1 Tax=Mucilaginibacter pedocola TaxID=1792845 RepID=A0A1S9PCU9_9SPHI|nr:cbb3-type cytochrome c oxidase N-terminal domain-containing protein [Mucilaginibacter pedocola]OOQ58741.1 cytochrome C [Mucilaginibacter pedocola]